MGPNFCTSNRLPVDPTLSSRVLYGLKEIKRASAENSRYSQAGLLSLHPYPSSSGWPLMVPGGSCESQVAGMN